jgi:hypothetical protein
MTHGTDSHTFISNTQRLTAMLYLSLEGTRILALELDKETTIAKISRGFDSIAANEDLTLKITSKSLSQLPAHKLFDMIVQDGFRHSKKFEVTQVLKRAEQEHAYIVTSSVCT